jgi:hypothetical protein
VARSWTPRELATLAALAETFVRGDAVRRARLTSETLDLAADPTQVRQIRLVLRSMESRLANLVLARRPRTFTSMSPIARQRYLMTRAHSRIGLRRSAFGSLRKLLTYFAYADPGVDASGNPRHAVIGYEPEWPPVTEDRTPIRPYTLPIGVGSADEATTLEADVVVGSGAGGGVVAAEMAKAGHAVVVLEAGPFVDEASMPRNELAAHDRLYLNHGLVSTWDGAITMLAGSGVGGGTLINWMTSIEAPAAVREIWAREHGLDGLADREACRTTSQRSRRSWRSPRSSTLPRRTSRSRVARNSSVGRSARSGETRSAARTAEAARSGAGAARSDPVSVSTWHAPPSPVPGSCRRSASRGS